MNYSKDRQIHFHNREHWEELRHSLGGIGGSDTGAILGISPWKTATECWHEKKNKIKREASPVMERGSYLEDVACQKFAESNGCVLEKADYMLRHDMHRWMIGNIDRFILTDAGIVHGLEVKVTTAGRQWLTDGIPPYYYSQMQFYMEVFEIDLFYLWAFDPVSWTGIEFPVERDQVFITEMVLHLEDFHMSLSGDHAPDEPQKIASKDKPKKIIWKETENEEFNEKLLLYKEACDTIQTFEDVKKRLSILLVNYCKQNSYNGLDTRSLKASFIQSVTKGGIDVDWLKQAHPEIDVEIYRKPNYSKEYITVRRKK